MAILCFEGSLSTAGRKVYGRIVELLGWKRGELKYRSVARAAARRGLKPGEIVSVLVSESLDYTVVCRDEPPASHDAKEELLAEALGRLRLERISLLVVDEQLVKGDASFLRVRRLAGPAGRRVARMRFASSKKTPGIQLADILAGCASHEECRTV